MKTWQVTSDDTEAGLRKWADGLSEAFVQLEPAPTEANGFFGSIRQVSAPQFDISLVRSNGHEIKRLDRHIRRRSPDIAFVNILSHGRSKVTQGRVFEAAPMDVSIVDARDPYSIRQDAAFELISVAVPSGWIDPATDRHCTLSRTAAGRELSNVLWSTAKMALTTGTQDEALNQAMAEQIRNGLALLPKVTNSSVDARTTVAMLQSYMQRHYGLPDLGALRLASHFNLSVRRVHQLFEPTGSSVSQYLNEIRLAKAAAFLSGNAPEGCNISDIAWMVGFTDPSYFTRRFKRRYGCSPRTYRQMQVAGNVALLS